MPKQREEKWQTFAQNSQVCTLTVMSKKRMPGEWRYSFLIVVLSFRKEQAAPFLSLNRSGWHCNLKVCFWLLRWFWWLSCLCFCICVFGDCGSCVFGCCGGCGGGCHLERGRSKRHAAKPQSLNGRSQLEKRWMAWQWLLASQLLPACVISTCKMCEYGDAKVLRHIMPTEQSKDPSALCP